MLNATDAAVTRRGGCTESRREDVMSCISGVESVGSAKRTGGKRGLVKRLLAIWRVTMRNAYGQASPREVADERQARTVA